MFVRFRRQHDQLRNVIVKVLRPTTSKASGEGEDGRGDSEAVFDTADANAIEEVNLAYEHVKEVDGLDLGKQGTDAWDAAQTRYVMRFGNICSTSICICGSTTSNSSHTEVHM